jgi:hypothetical protein
VYPQIHEEDKNFQKAICTTTGKIERHPKWIQKGTREKQDMLSEVTIRIMLWKINEYDFLNLEIYL